jgi:transcriptional regulator with XRE-family HTH domain
VTITPEQVRAARELLGWTSLKLALRVGVSEKAILAFEAGEQWSPPRSSTPLSPDLVRARLESAGVEFIAENEVRLRPMNMTRRKRARIRPA